MPELRSGIRPTRPVNTGRVFVYRHRGNSAKIGCDPPAWDNFWEIDVTNRSSTVKACTLRPRHLHHVAKDQRQNMQLNDKTEAFIQQLTENQTRLYGYVYSLLGDHSRASDVVQETNLVLWRKAEEFQAEKEFLPWAFGIARFQVMAHLRDRKRDRLLIDEELVGVLSAEAERQGERVEVVRTSLQACMQQLTPQHRRLIEHRYVNSMTLAEMATSAERTVGAVKVALLRIRRQLAECVEKRVASEGLGQ